MKWPGSGRRAEACSRRPRGADVDVELRGLAGLDDSGVGPEDVGRLVPERGDDLGEAPADDVLETGQPLEGRVHREVDEVVGGPSSS